MNVYSGLPIGECLKTEEGSMLLLLFHEMEEREKKEQCYGRVAQTGSGTAAVLPPVQIPDPQCAAVKKYFQPEMPAVALNFSQLAAASEWGRIRSSPPPSLAGTMTRAQNRSQTISG